METQKKMLRKKKIIIWITAILSLVGIIVYQLADRYLIEHVEVQNAFSNTGSTTQSANSTRSVALSENYT